MNVSISKFNIYNVVPGSICFAVYMICFSFFLRLATRWYLWSYTSSFETQSWNLQVPGILFTPICPHSLSFRPLILPEHVTLRVQIPFNSRSPAWASFDGKDRKQLAPGDALVCSMAPWPVPTACLVDSTNDFLRSIHEGLHWNLRKTQLSDGPRESFPWQSQRLSFLLAKLYLEIDMSFAKIYKTGCCRNYRNNYNLVYFSSLYD
jgi:hypothetical protein